VPETYSALGQLADPAPSDGGKPSDGAGLPDGGGLERADAAGLLGDKELGVLDGGPDRARGARMHEDLRKVAAQLSSSCA
jgi:hypothetical protein